MSTANKTGTKPVVAKEIAKDANKPAVTNSPEAEKPTADLEKTEATAKPSAAMDDKPAVPAKEPIAKDQAKPVAEKSTPNKTEPSKTPTKAERAKVIYDEMIQVPENGRDTIAARIKKDLGISKSAAQTYFYKFHRESGRAVEKQPTKVDRAKPVYEQMMAAGKTRKQIIEAFMNEVGLTKAGASTYYQNLKREVKKTTKPA
jgi:hypothetical protein